MSNATYKARTHSAVDKNMLNNRGGEYQGHMDTGKSKPSTKAKKLTGCKKEMHQSLFGGKRPGG